MRVTLGHDVSPGVRHRRGRGRIVIGALARRHPVLAYYVLVFAISWGAVLALVGPSGFVGTTAASPTFALAGVASLLGPVLAGPLMTALVDGAAGLGDLRARLLRWRVHARWYVVAVGTGPAVSLATLVLLSFASPAFVPAIVTADDPATVVWSGVGIGVIVAVCEELGWTGFAAPRLLRRHGVAATGVIMGLLWGAWHVPLFAGSASASGDVPPALFLAAMLFAWLVPYRVLMVWVYDRTRSLLVAMLMHVPIVVDQYVLTPAAISGPAMFVSLVAYGAALWLVAAAVVRTDGARSEPEPHHR
jgi:membrane protease YdiL (CAAX protease family)